MNQSRGLTTIEPIVYISIISVALIVAAALVSYTTAYVKDTHTLESATLIKTTLAHAYKDTGTLPYLGAGTCTGTDGLTLCCIGNSCIYNDIAISPDHTVTLNPNLTLPVTNTVSFKNKKFEGFFYHCTAITNGKCLNAEILYPLQDSPATCNGGAINYVYSDMSHNTICRETIDINK